MGFSAFGLAKLFAQDWEGDVTIVMPATFAQVKSTLLVNLSMRKVICDLRSDQHMSEGNKYSQLASCPFIQYSRVSDWSAFSA